MNSSDQTSEQSSEQSPKKIKVSNDLDEEQIIKRCIKTRIIEDCIYKLDNIIDKYLIDYEVPTDHNINIDQLSKINIANAKEECLLANIKLLFNKNTELYPTKLNEIVNDTILDIKKILN